MIREHGHDHETELARVASNPLAVVRAAKARSVRYMVGDKQHTIPRYDHVYALDTQTGKKVA